MQGKKGGGGVFIRRTFYYYWWAPKTRVKAMGMGGWVWTVEHRRRRSPPSPLSSPLHGSFQKWAAQGRTREKEESL